MKTALITGASSEVGISIAKTLESKYKLILIKHKADIDINQFSNKPIIYNCDLNNKEEVNKLINNLQNIKIDVLINAAAYDQNNSFENISTLDFEKTLQINLIAPFMLIQGLFKINDEGIIINIASTDGIDTFNEYNLTYATSKAALIHLTRQLTMIYKNIKIYAICPNYLNTESVKNMEPKFLQSELKRINQKKLLEVSQVSDMIEDILNNKYTENILRME